MKVTALVTQADRWWAIEVPEVKGLFTQAASLDEVPDQVRDAVSLMIGMDEAEIDVVVRRAAATG